MERRIVLADVGSPAGPSSLPLPRRPSCTPVSNMAGTITIRVDAEPERMLKRVVKLSRRTRSEITREALRRQLSLDLFE